jgi:sugar-specific transcriptional regulator TrmB
MCIIKKLIIIEEIADERLEYLNEIEHSSKENRKIIELLNQEDETVKTINKIIDNSSKEDVIRLKGHYEGVRELSRNLIEHIKESA